MPNMNKLQECMTPASLVQLRFKHPPCRISSCVESLNMLLCSVPKSFDVSTWHVRNGARVAAVGKLNDSIRELQSSLREEEQSVETAQAQLSKSSGNSHEL